MKIKTSLKDLTVLFSFVLVVTKTAIALLELFGKVVSYDGSVRELRLLIHQR